MASPARKRPVQGDKAEKGEKLPATRRLESIAGEAAGSVPDLDGIIHERSRLAIVSALATGDARAHTELRDLLGLTDGNLSVHARKLEEAGYVTCTKEFAGRTPRTTYRLAPAGRRAFDRYLAHLEGLISAMKARP
jgi:DNA-binding transcriptional ArsR family regulator